MTFRSGQSIASSYDDDFFPGAAAAVIPSMIDHILADHSSIAAYLQSDWEDSKRLVPHALVSDRLYGKILHVRAEKEFETRSFSFDRVPLGDLDATVKDFVPAQIEAYMRRRAIRFFAALCSHEPEMFFDGTLLKKRFEEDHFEGLRLFLRAVQLEPAFLQTTIGLASLAAYSFWFRDNAFDLANALRPPRAKRSRDIKNERHNLLIVRTLLVLRALVPSISSISDERLLQMLESKKYCVRMDLSNFAKLRKSVIRKSPKRTGRKRQTSST